MRILYPGDGSGAGSADVSISHASSGTRRRASSVWPGLLLTAAIAGLAIGLRNLPGLAGFSPMILAITIGIGFHNLIGTPAWAKDGVTFSIRRILRAGIVLLGLQLTVSQLVEVGAIDIGIIALTLIATFVFTIWAGRLLGVDRKLTELIAAGTSICGASAVIATNTVTRARDEDVTYAVACVTVFGSIAMLTYPLLSGPLDLGLADRAYGLWTGASIHEIAQVVAAAFQGGEQAGKFGTIAKLSRVMMLAPMIITLGLIATQRASRHGGAQAGAKTPVPWFVFGFVGLVVVNSFITLPPEAHTLIVTATTFLLAMALAAMGLETDIAKLRAKGLRPLLLGLASFFFIAAFSLMLVKLAA